MQRFFSFAMALFLGLSLTAVSFDADARRMGNKKSFGAAPSHQTRQAPQQTPAAAPNAAGAGAAAAAKPASGASKWLGPLAGLAAGGLLASMFMGDGFEGFQIMDFLLMAALAFAAFKIFQIMRRRNAPQAMPAGSAPYQRETAPVAPAAPIFGGASAATAAPVINAPAWFNEQSFIEAGRTHFLALQQHWDANEMDKIAEFVTPQMLEFLTRERAELGDGFQSTYIENLAVSLDGVDDNSDKTVATLTFSGISKNSRFDQGEAFSESWRLEREQGENQPWLLAGIRQN